MVQETIENEPRMEEEFFGFEPMDRFSDPEEVAQVVLFLASDMASHVTGMTMPVEGG